MVKAHIENLVLIPEFKDSIIFFSSEQWSGHEEIIVEFLKDKLSKNINIIYIETEKNGSMIRKKKYSYGIVTNNRVKVRSAMELYHILNEKNFYIYSGFITSSIKTSNKAYSSDEMVKEYFSEMRGMHQKITSSKNIQITGKVHGGYDDKISATFINIELRYIYNNTELYIEYRNTDNGNLAIF